MESINVTSDDTQSLRRGMRDLVALSTLPAIWTHAAPLGIADSLAEVLLRILSVDFIYVRLRALSGGAPPEALRTQRRAESVDRAKEIGAALGPWLKAESSGRPESVPNPIGSGTLRLAVLPIGHEQECGWLAAGSNRADFPTETERLLLGVGVNQATIVLQRKETEEQLHLTEARLEEVVANINDHFVCYDRQWRYTFVNDKAAEILGKPKADLLGRCIWELFPEAVGNAYYRDLHQSLSEQRVIRSEHYYLPFGRWFENHIYPSPEGVSVFSADITWRKEAEERLRRSESRYRALVEAGSQLVWSWNPETLTGDFEAVQRWWEELTGQPASLQGGVGWLDMLHPEDREQVGAAWTEAMTTASKFETEYRVRTRAGAYRHLLSRTVPVRDEKGSVREWVGMMVDVTEQKRQEKILKEADQRKDEFLAMLAHELRNPLAPIRSGLELIRIVGSDEPAIEEARTIMERQVTQLVRLTDDLLDIARITRGKIELRKEQVLLSAVVDAAVEASRPLIEKEGHLLAVTLPQEPVYLEGDPTRLSQALLNVLNNAAKYTDRGGRIGLTAQREGDHLLIQVKDNGIGIPTEMLLRIFETFTQVDRSLERSQGGLGIGLTLVKRMIEMHGGSVEARSEGRGKGSEFVVRLPIVAATRTAVPQEPDHEEIKRPPKRRYRILVVDDHEDSAKIMGMMLERMGNEIRTASDGEKAIGAAEAFRPDVIFLDIGMPKLNGYDAARQIREYSWGRNIILVALTGWGQDQDKRRSREAGFNFHVTKPIDSSRLKELFNELGPAESRV